MTSPELFRLCETSIPWADSGMVPVGRQRPFGFFPGGYGTFDESPRIAGKRFMILGQDFDTKAHFDAIIETPDSNPTWRNLRKLLEDLRIPTAGCFFTNVYMGLRESGRNTGACPGKRSAAYVQACREFFRVQLGAVRPLVLLVLGREPLLFLTAAYPEQLADWQGIRGMTDVHEKGPLSIRTSIDGLDVEVLAVIHPSLNAVNRSAIAKKIAGFDEAGRLREALGDDFLSDRPL